MKNIKNLRNLTSFIALSIICAGAFNIFAQPAECVPAMPEVYTHEQKDSTLVHYRLHGDEFLNYMTDSNGNLVTFAEDGDIYLARWADKGETDSFSTVSTNVKPVGSIKGVLPPTLESMRPLTSPIPQHHLERARNMSDERDNKWKEQFNSSSAALSKSVQAATRGIKERKVLIIYVSFANDGGKASMRDLEIPSAAALFPKIFNEATWGTVAHYYKTVTNGAVKIRPASTKNSVFSGVIHVQLPGAHGNWGKNSDSFKQTVIAVLNKASNASNPGGYIVFENFDTDNNNIITTDELSVGLIVHGFESSIFGLKPDYPSIWGHASSGLSWKINSKTLYNYFAQGAYHSAKTHAAINGVPTT